MKKQFDVVELAFRLCSIPSVTGEEAEVVNQVERDLQIFGFSTQRQTVGGKVGRDNLLAFVGQTVPDILLSTHLDTVPLFFSPQQEGEWLVGRGVCDAKGIAAAMMCAAALLLESGEQRVGLLFVVGEETDSAGAKAAVKFAPKVKFVINGEPTDLKLAKAMKGALVVGLEASGKAGHSAYPASGHSALHQLVDDAHAILHHPWPADEGYGQTTVNIGRMEGGVAGNVIAEHASALLVMRAATDVDQIEDQLKKLLHENTKATVHSKTQPAKLHEVAGVDTCVVAFGSDVPHLAPLGTVLLIGPGSILDAHTDHEKIRVSDLQKAVQVYKDLCLKLLTK